MLLQRTIAMQDPSFHRIYWLGKVFYLESDFQLAWLSAHPQVSKRADPESKCRNRMPRARDLGCFQRSESERFED